MSPLAARQNGSNQNPWSPYCFCYGRGGQPCCSLSERKPTVMSEDEIIAKLNGARQLAERFNLDFQEILDSTLRKFPADSVKALCARLKLPCPD
jgi:hypothetical protein